MAKRPRKPPPTQREIIAKLKRGGVGKNNQPRDAKTGRFVKRDRKK